jgi:hypothetical protein
VDAACLHRRDPPGLGRAAEPIVLGRVLINVPLKGPVRNHQLTRWGGWLPLPASECHSVEVVKRPRAKGATHDGNYYDRP